MCDHFVEGRDARSDHEESVIMSQPHLQCAGSLEERVAQLEAWARRAEAEIAGYCEQLQRCMAMTEGIRKSHPTQVAPAGMQCDIRERMARVDASKPQHTISFTTGSRQAEIAGIDGKSSSSEFGGRLPQRADIDFGSKTPDSGLAFSSQKLDALARPLQ